jgi:WD40 repeat protein
MFMSQRFRFVLILFVFTVSFRLSAQTFPRWQRGEAVLPDGHQGAVNALCYDEAGRLLSAGADGFLEIWDTRTKKARERFQISRHAISAAALRPGKTQISVVERDTSGMYHVSVWDYVAKKKYFTQSFREPISALSYSAGGTFIIAGRGSMTGLIFIQAESGQVMSSAPDIKSVVSRVATGKSERTMVSYLPSGILSYWDLRAQNEIQRVAVQSQLLSPVFFGNNRFLAGIDTTGATLLIIDAVSGVTLAQRQLYSRGGILLPVTPESTECVYLAYGAFSSTVYHIAINSIGMLEIKNQWQTPIRSSITSMAIIADGVALGTADGTVWLGLQTGGVHQMSVESRQSIVDVAASASALGVLTQGAAERLTESSLLGFIPLDYHQLTQGMTIPFDTVAHTSIASGDSEAFLLWQDKNIWAAPFVRVGRSGSEVPLQNVPHFAIRKAITRGEKALFLDSAGNITILSINSGELLFSFSAIGSLDVAFLNDNVILIGRSAVSGNTPFLRINTVTGETVPLAYPASVGVRVYGGANVYGAALIQGGVSGTASTVLLQLNTGNPTASTKLFEVHGEEIGFDLAEADNTLASTLGENGVSGYRFSGAVPFERSPGLPTRLVSAKGYFISVDTDGNIAWYTPRSGQLQALFHLSGYRWTLETQNGATLYGSVEKTR